MGGKQTLVERNNKEMIFELDNDLKVKTGVVPENRKNPRQWFYDNQVGYAKPNKSNNPKHLGKSLDHGFKDFLGELEKNDNY